MSISAKTSTSVQYATIKWLESGEPFSCQFEDIYFSEDDGFEESEYVFIGQNQLIQRWANNKALNITDFNIAELGFGSGLNFLVTLYHWQLNPATEDAQLNYFSFEQYPFSENDFKQMEKLVAIRWPHLLENYQKLKALYPIKSASQHLQFSDTFSGKKVNLNLYFKDAFTSLSEPKLPEKNTVPELKPIDAWYLDGFDPAKNTSLWNQNLYHTIKQRSHEKASFSTYTAAGHVRRGLAQAGFEVKKVKGFGRKRDMLVGHLS